MSKQYNVAVPATAKQPPVKLGAKYYCVAVPATAKRQ